MSVVDKANYMANDTSTTCHGIRVRHSIASHPHSCSIVEEVYSNQTKKKKILQLDNLTHSKGTHQQGWMVKKQMV